jgi:hypothetical protein
MVWYALVVLHLLSVVPGSYLQPRVLYAGLCTPDKLLKICGLLEMGYFYRDDNAAKVWTCIDHAIDVVRTETLSAAAHVLGLCT